MFESARIKLTGWYLLIIMLVSVFFSVMIFVGVTQELERGFRRAELRLHAEEIGMHLPRRFSLKKEDLRPELRELTPRFLLIEDIEDAKKSMVVRLIMINGMILIVSAAVSYVMAGKTLAPIEKAMEEQKRFVADASHELRTPLTALKTSIEVALRQKSLNARQAKKVLKESLEDVDHLSDLSKKLLHLSRLQQGVKLNFSEVDLKDLVKQVKKKMRTLVKKKGITVETELSECSAEVEAEQIQEMLTIFLDNAIKYTAEEGKVLIKLYKQKRQAVIKIQDTGVGIPQEHLPHIFDRFYRVDSAREKRKIDGFGLGLSLAKRIIEAHKGTIKVKSTVGKGTTFTIKFPLQQS